MRNIHSVLLLLTFLLSSITTQLCAQHALSTPTKLQLSQSKCGYGMFIHFGPNTFNETEWSHGNLLVSSYKLPIIAKI